MERKRQMWIETYNGEWRRVRGARGYLHEAEPLAEQIHQDRGASVRIVRHVDGEVLKEYGEHRE